MKTKKLVRLSVLSIVWSISRISASALTIKTSGIGDIPIFKSIFLREAGDDTKVEWVRIDSGGIYLSTTAIQGTTGVLKLNGSNGIQQQPLTNDQIADNSITSINIANGSIINIDFADSSVTNNTIANYTLTTGKFTSDITWPTSGTFYYTQNVCSAGKAITAIGSNWTVTCSDLPAWGIIMPWCGNNESPVFTNGHWDCKNVLLSADGGDLNWTGGGNNSSSIPNVVNIPVGTGPWQSTVVGTHIYVINSNSNNVSVIDSTNNTIIATIPVGNQPSRSTAVGNYLYIVNFRSDNVSVINTTNNTVIATIPVGHYPMRLTAVGNYLYVSNDGSNNMSVISTTNNAVIATIPMGGNPIYSIAIGNYLYVNNEGLNSISVINTANNTITATVPVGNFPSRSTVVWNYLYITNTYSNNVSVINTTNNTITATIPVGNFPKYSTLVGSYLYVTNYNDNSVSVINTANNTVIATIPVGNHPSSAVAIGNSLYVSNNSSNNISVINTTSNTVVSTIPVGNWPVYPTAVWSYLYVNNDSSSSVSVIDTTAFASSDHSNDIRNTNVNGGHVGVGIMTPPETLTVQNLACVNNYPTNSGNWIPIIDRSFKVVAWWTNGDPLQWLTEVRTMVQQPDGKIIIGGQSQRWWSSNTKMARLNPDGSIDTWFGVKNEFGAYATAVRALALQPDGKILVGGSFDWYSWTAAHRIFRLNANGTLDSWFDAGNTFSSRSSEIDTIVVQPNWYILVGWARSNATKAIVRLTTTGAIDPSFSSPLQQYAMEVRSIALQPDGKILVGTLWNSSGTDLFRLQSNWAIDTNFMANLPTPIDRDISAIALQPDKKIIIGWENHWNIVGIYTWWRLLRLNEDGTPDTSFVADKDIPRSISSISVLPDNKILLGGSSYTNAYPYYRDRYETGHYQAVILKLNTDWSAATWFDNQIGYAWRGYVNSIIIQNNGQVVVWWYWLTQRGVDVNADYTTVIRLRPISDSWAPNACDNSVFVTDIWGLATSSVPYPLTGDTDFNVINNGSNIITWSAKAAEIYCYASDSWIVEANYDSATQAACAMCPLWSSYNTTTKQCEMVQCTITPSSWTNSWCIASGTGWTWWERPALSPNGQFILYNNGWNMYLYDVSINKTIVIPWITNLDDAYNHGVTNDWRYIVYESVENSVASGAYDAIFLYDRTNNTTTRIGVDSNGNQWNGSNYRPIINASGTYIFFTSTSTNIATNPIYDGFPHEFVYNTATHTIDRINGWNWNWFSTMGEDAPFVFYNSWAWYNHDLMLYNIISKWTSTLLHLPNFQVPQFNNRWWQVSSDGRFLVRFWRSDTLVSWDTNNASDIFLYDKLNNSISRISVNGAGTQWNSDSTDPAISPNGRYILYLSAASNLVPWDTNNIWDRFLYDRTNNTTERVSVDSSWQEHSYARPYWSHTDRGYVTDDGVTVFETPNSLATNDTISNSWDIYAHDKATWITKAITIKPTLYSCLP